MRLIGKILLACLLVLVGYLFWPQTPVYTDFNPQVLAESDIQSWQAMARGRWLTYWWVNCRVTNGQFRFPAYASASMAYYYTRATAVFASAEPEKAKSYLRDYYRILQKAQKRDIDTEALADREFEAWKLAASGKADPVALASMSAEQWAALAGGKAEDYVPASRRLAAAALVYGSKGEQGLSMTESLLRNGYQKLLDATQRNK